MSDNLVSNQHFHCLNQASHRQGTLHASPIPTFVVAISMKPYFLVLRNNNGSYV